MTDVQLFLRSFDSDAEAFFFFGRSNFEQVALHVDDVRAGRVSLRRRALDRPHSAPPAMQTAVPAVVPAVAPPPAAEVVKPRPALALPVDHPPVLVFDTETVGLKPAIVCQLGYVVIRGDGVVAYDEILKLPPLVRVSRQAQNVHGISTLDCATRGVDAAQALDAFAAVVADVLKNDGVVVGHNVKFDVRAIGETRAAHQLAESPIPLTVCLMERTRVYSPLKNKVGRAKPFRNDELYTFLYGEDPTWARLHCAIDDVYVTALNYVAGRSRGWWA